MPHFRRARWGLRRTFQTEQAIEELSVAANVALAHEHSRLGSRALAPRGRARRARLRRPRRSTPTSKVGTLGARERRLVEVARAVVGKPRLVLLDEPAAGLPDEETEHLGARHPRDPGAHGRARDPRRPRHEPRLRLLRGHGGARLRQADRRRPDRRGAARRAGRPRLPRHRGRRGARPTRRAAAALRRHGRRAAAARRARGLARDPARRGHRAARPERRGQVDARARRRGRAAAPGRIGRARRARPRRHGGPSASARPAWRSCPRDGGCCPTSPSRTTSTSPPTRSRARRRGRPRVRARAVPGARPSASTLAARSLSGGEQQMLVLAQALVSKPQLHPHRRALARARAGHRPAARPDDPDASPSRGWACCSSSSSRRSRSRWPTARTSWIAGASSSPGSPRS